MSEADFNDVVEVVGRAIDGAGVAVIAIGVTVATAVFVRRLLSRTAGVEPYRRYREAIGKSILLGLEFLVAADIIRTVAVEPTFRSVGVLALIVLVRTFLSFTLEVELEGRWPWQRRTRGAD